MFSLEEDVWKEFVRKDTTNIGGLYLRNKLSIICGWLFIYALLYLGIVLLWIINLARNNDEV